MPLITIKSITHSKQVSKRTGKEFESCKITVVGKDGKDVRLSGFGDDITKTWCAGDKVDVNCSQTDKGYWNFEVSENSKPAKSQLELLRGINTKLDLLLGKDVEKVAKDFGGSVVGAEPVEQGDSCPDFLRA